MLLKLLVGIIIAAVVYHFYKTRSNPLYKIPGPTMWPLIGYINIKPLQLHLIHIQFRQQFGKLVHFMVMGTELLCVYDPEICQEILHKHRKKLSKGPTYEKGPGAFLGQSLLISKGDQWSKQRALLRPNFSHEAISASVRRTEDHCRHMLDRLVEGLGDDEATVKLGVYFRSLTTYVIGEFAMGVDLSEYQESLLSDNTVSSKLAKCLPYAMYIGLGMPSQLIPGKVKADFEEGNNYLRNLVDQIIRDRKATGVNEENKEENLLNWMLYHQSIKGHEWVTDEEIANELLTFIWAGSDTTAQTIACLMRMLAENPDVLSRVNDEIEAVDEPPESLKGYKEAYPYTEQCIRETLRLWTPVSGVGRYTIEELDLKGIRVPKNTFMIVSPLTFHRDKDYWGDDAENFNPDRFGPEQKVEDSYYQPFVSGQRDCIGRLLSQLEMNIVVPMFLRRFSIRLPADTKPLSLDDLESHASIIAKDDLPLVLEAW